ncbi:16S rRNA processing protein RimM [hydrothermal vent metagenome]|uniref:16S rRNA processing protein RimM n=1 Tax=hydrothermal vent metagenome TaxID=652676 RepID=A0A3B0T6M0_9ZZZZ
MAGGGGEPPPAPAERCVMAKASDMENAPERVCLGRITGVHGVRGLLTVRPYTEVAEDIAAYGPVHTASGRRLELKVKSAKKAGLIVTASGVLTREDAEALRGQEFFAARDRLPETGEDEWYRSDLVGLAAISADGEALGTVVGVENFGAGDLLEIAPPTGPTIYLPFTSEVVPRVDVAGGQVVVAPPEGSFDTDEAS